MKQLLPLFFLFAVSVYCFPTTPDFCPADESFQSCGTACEPTCENKNPEVCTKQCIVNVCQCNPGFVRHEGKCIFPALCPKTCPENEVLEVCGTACEPSCENPDPLVCTMQCLVNVCQCQQGFVRNSAGSCVLQSECPSQPLTPKWGTEEEEEN